MEQVWRGLAKSCDGDEVTFIVSYDPKEPEMHVESASGERADRLGKGAYYFKGKQYQADDPNAG